MDQRRHYLFLCWIYCIHYSLSEFVNLTIDNKLYFLSTTFTNATYAASQCSSQLSAELAFFDTNEEYHSVARHLATYFRDFNKTDLGVWVEIKATVNKTDGMYEHWWKNEQMDKGVWAFGEPDSNCLRYSLEKCCVRITGDMVSGSFLRDKLCSDNTCYYLCKSLNECQDGRHNCSQSQVCVDRAIGYECVCRDGYKLADDGAGCVDVNECQLELCHQLCNNTPGSYNCSCFSGYDLAIDRHSCQDVNECHLGVCNHTCTNLNGSYTCACHPGFRLTTDNTTCNDFDECAAQEKPCQQNCHNGEGTFSCSCNRGYTLMIDNKTCEAINYCLQSPCPGPCINTVDGYVCGCYEGFEDVQSQCIDVDECTKGIHKCVHTCQNTEGSYNCSCMQGYETSLNNTHVCEDIDECADDLDICSQICLNTDGSYSCSCQNGFVLDQSDNKSCLEINDCYNDTNTCQPRCKNTSDSLSCSCPLGHVLQEDGISCVETTEPHECPCNCRSYNLLKAYMPELFAQEIKYIQRNISIDKARTSLALRKKSSIENVQTSAKAVGGTGVVIVTIFFSVIVCSDVISFGRYVLFKYSRRHGRRSVTKIKT